MTFSEPAGLRWLMVTFNTHFPVKSKKGKKEKKIKKMPKGLRK
jgi:hypothetical protein